ncbi:MAG: DNA polymerase III subunit gamma/tau [Oscillospiraceae bacterium]|jgi:DNA polymerase-3 subunit gamma/tau|nr:DNA polymerase III subunit gamma/tau [Oscillospiraceae bacterium]
MYKVLYRKWRPETFDDVVGQSHIVQTLKNELVSGKIAHAYLFAGSRGTGKTTCSKILAKAVNCLAPRGGNPCRECAMCVEADKNALPDVVEIDAASNNSVEDVRQLREEVQFPPASAKYRVYIIDEVHMLSKGAFNALLKIMEEPPDYVIFILATTEVHKIPATILSRCQRFDFLRVSPDCIADRLIYIAGNENIPIDRDAARLIGRISDGGMRDAVSLLDQCSALSEKVDYSVVSKAAGLADQSHIFSLADMIAAGDCEGIVREIGGLYEMALDLKYLCEGMISHFRNLMIAKSVKAPEGLLSCFDEEVRQLRNQAKNFNLSAILYAIEVCQNLHRRIASDASGRALFESALIRLARPETHASPEAIAARLENLELLAVSGKLSRKKKNAQEAQEEIPGEDGADARVFREENPPPEVLTVDGKLENWPEVLKLLKKKNPPLAATLDNSSAYISGDLLLIDAPNPVFADLMRASDVTKESLRKAVEEKTGRTYRLGPAKRGAVIQEKNSLKQLREVAEQNGIETNQPTV